MSDLEMLPSNICEGELADISSLVRLSDENMLSVNSLDISASLKKYFEKHQYNFLTTLINFSEKITREKSGLKATPKFLESQCGLNRANLYQQCKSKGYNIWEEDFPLLMEHLLEILHKEGKCLSLPTFTQYYSYRKHGIASKNAEDYGRIIAKDILIAFPDINDTAKKINFRSFVNKRYEKKRENDPFNVRHGLESYITSPKTGGVDWEKLRQVTAACLPEQYRKRLILKNPVGCLSKNIDLNRDEYLQYLGQYLWGRYKRSEIQPEKITPKWITQYLSKFSYLSKAEKKQFVQSLPVGLYLRYWNQQEKNNPYGSLRACKICLPRKLKKNSTISRMESDMPLDKMIEVAAGLAIIVQRNDQVIFTPYSIRKIFGLTSKWSYARQDTNMMHSYWGEYFPEIMKHITKQKDFKKQFTTVDLLSCFQLSLKSAQTFDDAMQEIASIILPVVQSGEQVAMNTFFYQNVSEKNKQHLKNLMNNNQPAHINWDTIAESVKQFIPSYYHSQIQGKKTLLRKDLTPQENLEEIAVRINSKVIELSPNEVTPKWVVYNFGTQVENFLKSHENTWQDLFDCCDRRTQSLVRLREQVPTKQELLEQLKFAVDERLAQGKSVNLNTLIFLEGTKLFRHLLYHYNTSYNKIDYEKIASSLVEQDPSLAGQVTAKNSKVLRSSNDDEVLLNLSQQVKEHYFQKKNNIITTSCVEAYLPHVKRFLERKALSWTDLQEKFSEEMQQLFVIDSALYENFYTAEQRVYNAIQAQLKKSLPGYESYDWQSYFPYDVEQLMEHLEALFNDKMTWDNYGKYWHIDHIFPKRMFQYECPEDADFKLCWALGNLQPLPAIDNFSKSDYYFEANSQSPVFKYKRARDEYE